jgi:hypothetical protein
MAPIDEEFGPAENPAREPEIPDIGASVHPVVRAPEFAVPGVPVIRLRREDGASCRP